MVTYKIIVWLEIVRFTPTVLSWSFWDVRKIFHNFWGMKTISIWLENMWLRPDYLTYLFRQFLWSTEPLYFMLCSDIFLFYFYMIVKIKHFWDCLNPILLNFDNFRIRLRHARTSLMDQQHQGIEVVFCQDSNWSTMHLNK